MLSYKFSKWSWKINTLKRSINKTWWKRCIDVVGTTFDGDSAHRIACELLGANFDFDDNEKFKPYIDHPATGKPVHIFFDPCHNLKLVRNYFGSKNKHLIYDKKEIIDWKYIKKLHEKQINEGLHCACKIRKRHVNFKNEKWESFLQPKF